MLESSEISTSLDKSIVEGCQALLWIVVDSL